MSLRQDIRAFSVNLDTPDLLRLLIKDKFPGEVVVTASLMASSIVVLKMISDIDPATPIIFCQRPPIFDESREYRAKIVEQLGLQNVSTNEGHEPDVRPGDKDHCERMAVHYRDLPGRSIQLLHLNDCLAPFKCWISAVYHLSRESSVQTRVDVDGLLIKVDPLLRWSKEDVRQFMREQSLPYHKMAKRQFSYDDSQAGDTHSTYHF